MSDKIPFILKAPYNGISQDSFYGDNGECLYMENISNDEMRYAQLDKTFVLISGGNTGVTTNVNQMVESPNGIITCGDYKVLLNGGDKSATVGGAQRVEFTGDLVGNQSNFFITPSHVVRTNGDISAITNTPPIKSGLASASILIYTDILYAVGSVIWKYDTLSADTAPTNISTQIPIIAGSTVKYMYFYNDMLVIVTSKGYDTIIYQVQYASGTYSIYSREIIVGEMCVNAIGDRGSVYWITTSKIFQFNGGQSLEVRFIGSNSYLIEATFGSSAKIAFNKGKLMIANGTDIYIWGSRHSGRRKALTKKTFPQNILGITGNYIQTQIDTNFIYANSSKYPDSGFYLTLPTDSGVYGDVKDALAFRIGYQLPIGTSIAIGVMTDEMEMINTASYITVATITDTAKRWKYISVKEINDALSASNYSSEWQYIRFKPTLIGGGGSAGLRDNTPRLFDIKAIYEETEDNLIS